MNIKETKNSRLFFEQLGDTEKVGIRGDKAKGFNRHSWLPGVIRSLFGLSFNDPENGYINKKSVVHYLKRNVDEMNLTDDEKDRIRELNDDSTVTTVEELFKKVKALPLKTNLSEKKDPEIIQPISQTDLADSASDFIDRALAHDGRKDNNATNRNLLSQAFDTMNEMKAGYLKETVLSKLAAGYMAFGDMNKTHEIIDLMSDEHRPKIKCLAELALERSKVNLKESLELADLLYDDARESVLQRIIDRFVKEKEFDKCLEVIPLLKFSDSDKFICKLILEFYKPNNDLTNAQQLKKYFKGREGLYELIKEWPEVEEEHDITAGRWLSRYLDEYKEIAGMTDLITKEIRMNELVDDLCAWIERKRDVLATDREKEIIFQVISQTNRLNAEDLNVSMISKLAQSFCKVWEFGNASRIANKINNEEMKSSLLAKISSECQETFFGGPIESSEQEQKKLHMMLEEILSKNEDKPILVFLKKISDPDKKNEFITRFAEKYISEKKYIAVGALLDQCEDKQLINTLEKKVWAAMDSDK